MVAHEMEARIYSLEALVSSPSQGSPEARRTDIVTDLREHTPGRRGQVQIAEPWDDEIRGDARTPEATPIEILRSRRRRSAMFGVEP